MCSQSWWGPFHFGDQALWPAQPGQGQYPGGVVDEGDPRIVPSRFSGRGPTKHLSARRPEWGFGLRRRKKNGDFQQMMDRATSQTWVRLQPSDRHFSGPAPKKR